MKEDFSFWAMNLSQNWTVFYNEKKKQTKTDKSLWEEIHSKYNNTNLYWTIQGMALHPLLPDQIGIYLEMLVFVEGKKPENLAKTPWNSNENWQQTQPTYTRGVNSAGDSNQAPLGKWELTPLRHPCSFWGWTHASSHYYKIA